MAFKKYSIILVLLVGLVGVLSCADVSLGGSSSGFTFNVTNGTGGPLATLVFGGTSFENVPAGETRSVVLKYRSLTEDVAYTTAEANGFGETLSKTITVTTSENGNNSFSYDLPLDSDYAAVWVETICETAGRNIDLVGIGTSSADDTSIQEKESMAFLNVDGWATYSNYRGVEDEELPFTTLASPVTGTLVNTDGAYLTITAAVTGETLTADVTADDIVDGLASCPGETGEPVLRGSIKIMSQDGATEVAADDGEGNLVSAEGYLDTEKTNRVDYRTGEITCNLAESYDFGTMTASYRYIKAYKYEPKSYSESNLPAWAGSLVLKVGDRIIAQEVYDEGLNSYYLEGDALRASSSSYDYSTNELTLSFFEDINGISTDTIPEGEDLILEYRYRIARDAGGDGNIDDDLFGVDSSSTVDYVTGAYTLTVDEAVFTAMGHTVTDLYCRYHIPYAMSPGVTPVEQIFNPGLDVSIYENLDFDGPTGVVDAYLGQKLIEPGSVILSVSFYDASGVEEAPIELVDDGNGDVIVSGGTDDVGDVDYVSGKIRLVTPQATVDAGYVMASARALQYNYHAVTDSAKIFAGFFKKSDLSGRSFYVLNMDSPPGMVAVDAGFPGYWEFSNFDLLYHGNSAGSVVMNLVCADDNFQ